MKTAMIPLTDGHFAIVDVGDLEYLTRFKWRARLTHRKDGSLYSIRAFRKEHQRLGYRSYSSKQIWMHREILGFPESDVDHIDGNALNNTRANLRPVTKSQNMANRRKLERATSVFKGVYWYPNKSKWHSAVSFQKKKHSLGYFVDEKDAALAYNEAALRFHGEYARLNEIAA